MTGIEKLRKLSDDFTYCRLWYALITGTEEGWGCYRGDDMTVSDVLETIADQIEAEQDRVAQTDWDTVREVAADMAGRVFMSVTVDGLLRDWSRRLNDATDGHVVSDEREARAPFSLMRVLAVISDMKSRVSDTDGSFGALVDRWARELHKAVDCREHDPAEDVSVSAYALLPEEDREALRWVREHGGLDHVKAEWCSRVPFDVHEKRRRRLLDHIAECEAALGRRNVRIEELGHRVNDLTNENAKLRRRAMPEGYEWPRYESGEPVEVGDEVSVTVHDEDGDFERTMAADSISFDERGVIISDPCHFVRLLSEERVRRPERKCRDCAHWQKDPTADKMGVCWFFYHEHEGQDCYSARLGNIGACDKFMPRDCALAERERGE